MPKPLRGIIPPMVTPLLDPDTLDQAGLERLIEHILAGGVHALFILGTTGETASLSHRLRCELVERACALVNRRLPVLVGITDTSFVESVKLAGRAAQAGAQALVLGPPYYYTINQQELLEYLRHIVPQLPLPVVLYNIPIYPKPAFAAETVVAASDLPGIIGIKDSSGDMVYFRRLQSLLKHKPDFSLFVGSEQLLAETILLGGHGGICGGANLAPRLYVDLYNAACAKDLPAAQSLHETIMQINETIFDVCQSPWSFIKTLKYALSSMGICSDLPAEPFQHLGDRERDLIRCRLEEMRFMQSK